MSTQEEPNTNPDPETGSIAGISQSEDNTSLATIDEDSKEIAEQDEKPRKKRVWWWQCIIDHVTDYCDNTTLHGFAYLPHPR